jgi:hypothetical protein
MNVTSLITKEYRKKDDFAVRKNKPNSKSVLSAVEWANFKRNDAFSAYATCRRVAEY